MRLSPPIQLEKSVRSQLVMRSAQEQQERMGWRWGPVVVVRGYERARQRGQRALHLATAHQQA